jgi:hypothetical protein
MENSHSVNKNWLLIVLVVIAIGEGVFIAYEHIKNTAAENTLAEQDDIVPAALVASPFLYTFDSKEPTDILNEAGSMKESESPYWWVNSGGYLILKNGTGSTILGSLEEGARWQSEYARTNPRDTDNGTHPQNIFRLVARSVWKNFRQEAFFKIDKDNLSQSENRNESNGLLFFNHYQDGQNLYYTGIRVDGNAVIKKKIAGTYYTMAITQIFPGTYDHDKNPNLLPHNVWIGMRSEIIDNTDGSVEIRLYTDKGVPGQWQLVLSAKDDGKSFGGKVIGKPGYAGIRTDFMDVEFKNYKLENI